MNRSAIAIAIAATALLSVSNSPGALAHDYSIGSLRIGHPWARATPPAAKVGAGYLKIGNTGSTHDRLLGGTTQAAARFEIHEITFADGIARMRLKTDGVGIAPGEVLELKPNAIHLMLVDLNGPLKQGDKVKAILRFEKAGELEIEFQVQGIGAKPQATPDHAAH